MNDEPKKHRWKPVGQADAEKYGEGSRTCHDCGAIKRTGNTPSGWVYRGRGQLLWERSQPPCT